MSILLLSLLLTGCSQADRGELQGTPTATPSDFSYLGHTSPCFLEVGATVQRSIRVNCFHIDGVLHIHSNRFAKLPRFSGESWVDTVLREPDVRVAIDEKIYSLRGRAIEDESRRVELLHERGYSYAWDGITVFSFHSRAE